MMSRRAGEVILIGGDIEIVISRIGRSPYVFAKVPNT